MATYDLQLHKRWWQIETSWLKNQKSDRQSPRGAKDNNKTISELIMVFRRPVVDLNYIILADCQFFKIKSAYIK